MNNSYSSGMRFGPSSTPQVIRNLLIANLAVFVGQLVIPPLSDLGVVIPERVWLHLELWRPFTYLWLHSVGGLSLHLAINMFMLWMFGSELALDWGEKRFLRYYLTCGIGAGFLIATLPFLPMLIGWGEWTTQLDLSTLGASGAVIAVVLAYSLTWPYQRIQLLFPPIAIKAIWLIPIILIFEFMGGRENVSHLGHLGGLLIGWIYLIQEGRTPGIPTPNSLWHDFRGRKNQKSQLGKSLRKPPRAVRPPPKRSLKRRYERRTMRKKLRSLSGEGSPKSEKNEDEKS